MSSERPSVSIVTICMNAGESLRSTMESVLSELTEDMEYILIDGGSTDGSLAIIEEYADRLSYWVSEPDKGISDAFNKGIAKANGQLIGLLNAGDEYVPRALKTVCNAFNGEDVLYGNMSLMKNGEEKGTFQPEHSELEHDMTLCHPSTFISRAAYDEWGLYNADYRLAMDYELLLRFYSAGARFKKVDHTLARMDIGGISDQHWRDALKEVGRAQEHYLGESMVRDLKTNLKISKRSLSRKLANGPLASVVEMYQRRFSRIKKI